MEWPLHDAVVTHLRVVGLASGSDWQTNVVVRRLHVRPEPFGEGAMRYAFPATTEDGKRFVLKARSSQMSNTVWRSFHLLINCC